jgi:hypothetical protein
MNKGILKNLLAAIVLLAALCNGAEAMAQHTLTQAGASQQKWLVTQQAEVVVQTEISNLNTLLSQMNTGGASQEDIAKVQFQLAVYYHIAQALKAGKSTQESYEYTWANMGDGDDAATLSPADKQTLQGTTRSKLTE